MGIFTKASFCSLLGICACFFPGGDIIEPLTTDSAGWTSATTPAPGVETSATTPTTSVETTSGMSNSGDTNSGSGGSVASCGDACATSTGDTSDTTAANACDTCGSVCGDGVQDPPEECDDGNMVADDGCDNSCLLAEMPRTVFVTAALIRGDFGGVEGDEKLAKADLECQGPATEHGYTGIFRAWMSSDTVSPASRFDTEFTGEYRRLDGKLVAQGWKGLVSGTLVNPIDIDDNAALVLDVEPFAWTSTATSGMAVNGHCDNWSNSAPPALGLLGSIHATDDKWTFSSQQDCGAKFRIYCIQDG